MFSSVPHEEIPETQVRNEPHHGTTLALFERHFTSMMTRKYYGVKCACVAQQIVAVLGEIMEDCVRGARMQFNVIIATGKIAGDGRKLWRDLEDPITVYSDTLNVGFNGKGFAFAELQKWAREEVGKFCLVYMGKLVDELMDALLPLHQLCKETHSEFCEPSDHDEVAMSSRGFEKDGPRHTTAELEEVHTQARIILLTKEKNPIKDGENKILPRFNPNIANNDRCGTILDIQKAATEQLQVLQKLSTPDLGRRMQEYREEDEKIVNHLHSYREKLEHATREFDNKLANAHRVLLKYAPQSCIWNDENDEKHTKNIHSAFKATYHEILSQPAMRELVEEFFILMGSHAITVLLRAGKYLGALRTELESDLGLSPPEKYLVAGVWANV